MYRALALGCLAGALWLAWHHPLWPAGLTGAVLVWGALVWRWPFLWLFAAPSLLPVANGLPWTGWVAFQEFDLLLLASAAGGYAHCANQTFKLPRAPTLLLGLMLLAATIALGRAIVDAGVWRFDWFGGYQDAMNGLRVFKSILFAALFWPLLVARFACDARRAMDYLAAGVALGAALLALAVLQERFVYPGLLDFSTPYRATGWFWEMHIGGAAIDGYLALATPFAAWALLEARSRGRWLVAASLAVLLGYVCLMTYSRGVYLALVTGLVTLAWLRWRRQAQPGDPAVWSGRWRVLGSALVAMLLMLEIVVVVSGGSFLMGRLAQSNEDFGSRLAHWRHGVALLDGPADWWFGKGLGRLPARYPEQDRRNEIPVDLRLGEANGNTFALLSGPPTRNQLAGSFGMGQRIRRAATADFAKLDYQVEFDALAMARTVLWVSVCDKHLLYEAACVGAHVPLAPGNVWRHVSLNLAGDDLGRGAGWSAPHRVFAIAVQRPGPGLAMDNLLLTANGRPELLNGDFRRGLAHWFLNGEQYFVPWHIDNLALEILIDQGWFGLAVFVVLCGWVLWRLIFGGARFHVMAPYLAAAVVSLLMVGLFSSLMDVPRVAWLFFLFALVSLLLEKDDFSAQRGHE